MSMRRYAKPLAAALASAMVLSACATSTPYRPATGAGNYRTGYWDQQLESNRYAISFSGNSLTSRETVEKYLLFRAAELTIQRGFDHFTIVERDTDRKSRLEVDRPFPSYGYWGPGWGYWGPRWRYARRGLGWSGWGPYGYDPFFDDWEVRQIDRYEATAEIVMGRGAKPRDPKAFDARDVMQTLGPSIQYPKQR